MLSADEVRARSGVQEVWDSRLLGAFLTALSPRLDAALPKTGVPRKPDDATLAAWQQEFQSLIDAAKAEQARLFLLAPRDADWREYRREAELAAKLTGATTTGATWANTTCPDGRVTSTGC